MPNEATTAKDLRDDVQSVFLLGLKTGSQSRQIAEQAAGAGSSYLRGKDAFELAYQALLALPGSSANGKLLLTTATGQASQAGQVVSEWKTAQANRATMFDEVGANGPTILVVQITGIDVDALWKDDVHHDPAVVKGGPTATLTFFETALGQRADKQPDDANGTFQTLKGDKVSVKRRGNTSRWDRKINLCVALDGDAASGFPKQVNLLNCIRDPAYERVRLSWALMAEAKCLAEPSAYAEMTLDGVYHGTYVAMPPPDESFFSGLFPGVSERAVFRGQYGDIAGGATLANRGPKGAGYFTAGSNPSSRTYEPRLDTTDAQYDVLAQFIDVLHNSGDPTSSAFANSLLKIFDVATFLRTMATINLLGAWDNYYLNAQNYILHIALTDATSGSRTPFVSFCAYDMDSVLGLSWPSQKRNWQEKDILFRGTELGNIVLAKRVLENPDFRAYYCDFMAWFLEERFTSDWFARQRDAFWKRLEQTVYLESQSPFGPPDTLRPWTNDEVYRHAVLDQPLDASGSSAVGGLQVLGIGAFVRQRRERALAQLKLEQLGGSGVDFGSGKWNL